MTASMKFYTEILDFTVVQAPDPDPQAFLSKYAFLAREQGRLHLSAHRDDGEFGSVVFIRVSNIDDVFRALVDKGLNAIASEEVPGLTMSPVDQTWGMREFSVRDPDGNRLTYGQWVSD